MRSIVDSALGTAPARALVPRQASNRNLLSGGGGGGNTGLYLAPYSGPSSVAGGSGSGGGVVSPPSFNASSPPLSNVASPEQPTKKFVLDVTQAHAHSHSKPLLHPASSSVSPGRKPQQQPPQQQPQTGGTALRSYSPDPPLSSTSHASAMSGFAAAAASPSPAAAASAFASSPLSSIPAVGVLSPTSAVPSPSPAAAAAAAKSNRALAPVCTHCARLNWVL